MLKLFETIKNRTDNNLKFLGILITMYEKLNDNKNNIKVLLDSYSDLVFKNLISKNKVVPESQTAGVPICLRNDECDTAVAFKKITGELLERMDLIQGARK